MLLSNGVIKTAKDAMLCKSGTQVSVLNSFYAERSILLNTIISKLINSLNTSTDKVQLLILGAGYDDSYESNNAIIYIVDLPKIIEERVNSNTTTDNTTYISCDLRDTELLIQKLIDNNFDSSINTVILLECVLSYIDTNDVNKLLLSLSTLSSSSFLVLYDPIIPNDDGYFGTMISKFAERGAPLLHISKSRKQHLDMLKSCGWVHGSCYTINQASNCFLLQSQRRFISSTIFDEYASLALLKRHYSITICSNANNSNCSNSYNSIMQNMTNSNDITTLKSRIEVAKIRLESANDKSSTSSNINSNSKIIIRQANELDIRDIKALVSDVFQTYMEAYPTVKKFMKKSISKLPQDINNNDNNNNSNKNNFWVAEVVDDKNRDCSIIGCVGLRITYNNTSIGEIIHTCVAPSQRGKGVGKMLLNHVIAYAHSNRSIRSLHLSVMSFLKSARSLYTKVGFLVNDDDDDDDNSHNKKSNNDECYIVHMKLDLNI